MTDAAPPSFITAIDLSFPPAERLGAKVEYGHFLPHDQAYSVNVYFVGQAPEPATADRVLRECLALAAAHDGRFGISAHAYLLPDADADMNGREALNPCGKDRFLCFDAQLRQIGVRRYGKKHFEVKAPLTEVAVIGTGDGVDPPDRPVHPFQDIYPPDEDGAERDDATEDKRSQVLEWIWYGYYTAEAIARWIDEGAAEGEGFEHGWIQAFATAALDKKRAAEATWPEDTDCDRLDRAFERLNGQGLLVLQWAGNTMGEGMAAVAEALTEAGVPEDRYQGYCFFHSQDIDRALGYEGLMLAFGSTASEEDEDILPIGRLICGALEQEGLQTRWDGTADQRIHVPGLRWQRRTPQPD